MDETRRTIAELVARYQLEPSLRDVYVEGPFDASLLTWFLNAGGANNAAVYTISTVEISSLVLAKHSLTSGEKQRVVAFAREIMTALGDCPEVTCVIDADLDRVFKTIPTEAIVLVTDYPSLETYLFQQALLEQLLAVGARLPRVNVANTMNALAAALRELFLARCASFSLGWGLTWISLDAGLKKGTGEFAFHASLFLDRLLERNGRRKEKSTFMAEIEGLRSRLGADPRHAIQGHDFIELLGILIRRSSRQRWLHRPDAIRGSLAASVRRETLESEELLKGVWARIRNG